jgi:hypothetical protein
VNCCKYQYSQYSGSTFLFTSVLSTVQPTAVSTALLSDQATGVTVLYFFGAHSSRQHGRVLPCSTGRGAEGTVHGTVLQLQSSTVQYSSTLRRT